MIDKIDAWHKTKTGYTVFAVLELIVANVFFSFAIDSGNLFDYLFAVLFFVGSLQNAYQLARSFKRGH